MAAESDVPRKRSNSFLLLPPNMSELRVVILGSSWSQRSSVGNLLLNDIVFDVMKEPESPTRQTGKLQDKEISVINCPDLLQPGLTQDRLTELVTEIAEACDPGPHVFLLVLQPEDFTEQNIIRLQSVLRSFSEQAFHHSLVLVTATKESSVMDVKPPPLKDLIRKCKFRYQWVKSLESYMSSEVHKELFTKIIQIFKEDNGKHVIHDIYEDAPPAAPPGAPPAAHHQTKGRDGNIFTTVKGLNILKKPMLCSDSALRIVLFGKSDDKKTKMFNYIDQKLTEERAVVVKTPNLFSLPVDRVKEEMKKCVSECYPGPNVLLLLVKPSDFTENDRKTLTIILSLFGPGAFEHSMVVLTHNIQNKAPTVSKLISDCGGRFYNMFDENHKLLTDSLMSIVDENKGSFLTLTEEQKPSLNLVVFGRSGAEKTSVAESILGRAALRAARRPGLCVKREGEVCGRRVSLVELPALSGKPLETVMQQCLRCISLCAPEGVHAFILVLPLGPLTDEDKAELKTIQDTLSSRILLLTMVLFIVDSNPTAPAVLEFVEGDRDIQDLRKTCGGGYFIFNPRDQEQASQLLDYLYRNKTKNIDYSYTTETLYQAQIQMISAQHKEIEDMKIKTNRRGDSLSPDCLKIVLIGKTGNGKSSSGNTILGRKEFSAMASQMSVTKACKRAKSTVGGRSVAVVDTPGLFDTTMSNDEVFEEMLRCISLLAPGPHVFLVVLQIGRLTKEENDTLKLIKEGFGKEAQKFTIILLTHGEVLANDEMSVEDYIDKYCESSFKDLISKCGNRFHVFNNCDKENHTQVLELLQKIDVMVKENGGGCFTNDMLKEAEAAFKKEMKRIMKEKEEEMRKEKEEMERKYQQEMEEIKQKMDKQREERQEREKELRKKEERIKEKKEQQKRDQEKRKEEERKRKEEEKLQCQEWEQKRQTLEEKIRLEQESKEQFEVKLQENRRQMEEEREQWEKEKKEWWEKRKQEDEERRQQEKKLQEEIKQIESEKEQKEKELKEKEMKIKEEEDERKKEQKKRKEEDRKRKEQEEKQREEWEQKHKELEEKIKSEELSKEMIEIKLKENKTQMEQEKALWEKERKERLEKRKREDEERRQQEERRQKEMRQIKEEKEQKEKELKEKEDKYKEERQREQEKREKEENKRKEEEEQQRLEWELKQKELEEKSQSEAKSKKQQLEENKRQMEQERAQWERERKEWWEKQEQEDEERKQEEEKRQKEIEQEIKNYNERLKEDEVKLQQEEKRRKELEERHRKQVEELERNYEEKARGQAEEHNEFKEKYRQESEELKKVIKDKDKSYDLLQALTAHKQRQMMEMHQKEIRLLVKRLWARPDKLIKMNNLISKQEKEINELVTKHEEEINKATNEEEKNKMQKEQEEQKKTKQKQHEKEISELVEEVDQSNCVIS